MGKRRFTKQKTKAKADRKKTRRSRAKTAVSDEDDGTNLADLVLGHDSDSTPDPFSATEDGEAS